MRFLRWLLVLPKSLAVAAGWAGAVSAGIALATVAGTYFWLSGWLDDETARVNYVRTEIARLEKDIEEIRKLRDEITIVLARKRLIEQLHGERVWPAQLFDQLARIRPDGVVLRSAMEFGPRLHITGHATSYAEVSTLVRALGESPYLERPQLTEVRTEDVQAVAGYPVRFGLTAAVRGRPGSSSAGTGPGGSPASVNPGDPK